MAVKTGSLAGRIALVTGCSRGIGYEAARALAAAGAHIVLLARTQGALEELHDEIVDLGGSSTITPLDLRDFDKIDALGPALYERFQKLDILVANAGTLGTLTPLGHVTAQDWQEVIDVNLSANWRLIRTLDPALKQSDAGRAVFITSAAAHLDIAYWGPYSISKAALETMVRIYAAETSSGSIKANLLDPGAVRTAMRAKAFPGEDPLILPEPRDIAPLIVEMASPRFSKSGETVIYDHNYDSTSKTIPS